MFFNLKSKCSSVVITLLLSGAVHAELSDPSSEVNVANFTVANENEGITALSPSSTPIIAENACYAYVPSGNCHRPRQFSADFIGEFLYWRALDNGFDCGCSQLKNYDWNPGYRLGLWCQSVNSCCWGGLIWTHYYQNPHRGCSDECSRFWKLRYQTLDGILGGAISLNSCLSLNPYWGIRAAWISQKFFSVTKQESKCSSNNFSLITETRDKANFNGVGPLIGLNADYKLNRCFNLFGNLALGLLYGNHQLKSFGSETFTNPEQKCICCQKKGIKASQLFFDAAIGIRWEQTFCKNWHLLYQIGLEHHRYFEFNHIECLSDLCFDGVNVSLGIGF